MKNGLDWILRPCMEGFCKYESLIDGTLGLEDVAVMNDAISVRNANQNLIEKAAREEK